MALDPRIKVNQDGSYFYSGSVVDGVGRRRRVWEAGGKGYAPNISLNVLNGAGGVEISHVEEDCNRLHVTRVDTTSPFSNLGVRNSRPYRRKSSDLGSKTIFQYIYTNWALSPNHITVADGSNEPYLFRSNGIGFSPHFSYHCKGTECTIIGYLKQVEIARLIINVKLDYNYVSDNLDRLRRTQGIYFSPWDYLESAIKGLVYASHLQKWLEKFLIYGEVGRQLRDDNLVTVLNCSWV